MGTREIALGAGALAMVVACNVKTGASSKRVAEAIKETLGAKGLELVEVTCPQGPLLGEVTCTGRTADGVEVPVDTTIEKDGILRKNLQMHTRGVAVGAVVAERIGTSMRDTYGTTIDDLTCPMAVPEGQTFTCKGTLEGVEVVIETDGDRWDSKRGVVAAKKLIELVETRAASKGMDLGGQPLDCGRTLFPTRPGSEITCKNDALGVRFKVRDDGSGVDVVDSWTGARAQGH